MHSDREMLRKNHFPEECFVEIDGMLSFDLLCREDREKVTRPGIIPNTDAGKSTLGKGFRLFGLQSLLTRKIEEASKTDKGKKNVLSKHSDESDEQKCKEIEGQQNQQESGTSDIVATATAESSPVTTSRCMPIFLYYFIYYDQNIGFFAKYKNLTVAKTLSIKC